MVNCLVNKHKYGWGGGVSLQYGHKTFHEVLYCCQKYRVNHLIKWMLSVVVFGFFTMHGIGKTMLNTSKLEHDANKAYMRHTNCNVSLHMA